MKKMTVMTMTTMIMRDGDGVVTDGAHKAWQYTHRAERGVDEGGSSAAQLLSFGYLPAYLHWLIIIRRRTGEGKKERAYLDSYATTIPSFASGGPPGAPAAS